MEQLPSLIFAEIMRTATADVGQFMDELRAGEEELQRSLEPIRKALQDDQAICTAPTDAPSATLGAVDASSIIEHRSGFALLLALGIRVSPRGLVHNYQRWMGHDDIDFGALAQSVRLSLELDLLHDVDHFTIADHSFWSLLMVANQTCHALTHTAGETQARFEDLHAHMLTLDGTFVRCLRNPYVIGMSKTATGNTFAEKQGLTLPIADRSLFSLLLQENEYVKPKPIKLMTRGSPGVETSIADKHEIEDLFRANDGLLCTFYKPWLFQHAYRVEFHASLLQHSPGLHDLLQAIKAATRFRGILEPQPQFLADSIAKQLSPATELYVAAGLRIKSELMGIFRTASGRIV
jgi:hypothetical protein